MASFSKQNKGPLLLGGLPLAGVSLNHALGIPPRSDGIPPRSDGVPPRSDGVPPRSAQIRAKDCGGWYWTLPGVTRETETCFGDTVGSQSQGVVKDSNLFGK